MKPHLLRAVPVSVRPLKWAGTAVDSVFGGATAAGIIYGDPIIFRAQVIFHAYRSADFTLEGDVPRTRGTALIMASEMPVGVDLRNAMVDMVGDATVHLIVAEVVPHTFSHRGQATTYRLDLREAWQT